MVEQVKVFSKRGDGRKVLTARGKQTRVMTAPKIGYVDPQIMAVDRIVADLPGQLKKLVYRRYVFQQPDRIAAIQLRIPKDTYTERANAAIQYVGERLELSTRYGSLTLAPALPGDFAYATRRKRAP
jgi:hypothetical protein